MKHSILDTIPVLIHKEDQYIENSFKRSGYFILNEDKTDNFVNIYFFVDYIINKVFVYSLFKETKVESGCGCLGYHYKHTLTETQRKILDPYMYLLLPIVKEDKLNIEVDK